MKKKHTKKKNKKKNKEKLHRTEKPSVEPEVCNNN